MTSKTERVGFLARCSKTALHVCLCGSGMGKVPALAEEWGTDAIGVMWRLKKPLGTPPRELKPIGTVLAGFMYCWHSHYSADGAVVADSNASPELYGYKCFLQRVSLVPLPYRDCRPGLLCSHTQTVTVTGGFEVHSPKPLSRNSQCVCCLPLSIFT